jgi:hypothetical protein
MIQLRISYKNDPKITEEERNEALNGFHIDCKYEIGNMVNGKNLAHLIGTKEEVDSFVEALKTLVKQPKIIWGKERDGVAYGYYKKYNEETEEYDLIRDEEKELYECEDVTDYFADVDGEDEEGNPIKIKTPEHKFAGWK